MENTSTQMNHSEYTFFGNTIEKLSLKYGIFLIIWGTSVSIISQTDSWTSWIPAISGLPIFILALLSILRPNIRKTLMHLTVIIAFLIFIGGLDFFRSVVSNGNFFANIWADLSKLMMLVTGFTFCFLCINSFRFARRQKSFAENSNL